VFAISVGAVFILPFVIRRVLRRMPDRFINQQIKKNTATYRPGMETTDHEVLNRLGAVRRDELIKSLQPKESDDGL
jgi:hypothetical protein